MPGGLDDRQDSIERNGFVKCIDVTFESRIDRDYVIDAVDLNPVSREVNDSDIGIANRVGEIAQSAAHLARIEIVFQLDDIEAGGFESRRNGVRIIARIGEPAHVLIGGIADHQRYSLLRECGLTE